VIMRIVAVALMSGCLWGSGQSQPGDAIGTWEVIPRLSTGARAEILAVKFDTHSKGEVFTIDRITRDGRATTSSTVLYFDGLPRDLQDFGCSGTQSSRRLDSRTVEIIRSCVNGGSSRLVRRLSTGGEELVLEIAEWEPGGRRVDRRLVLQRQ